ncbi:MAG: hypothetical protein IT366_16235 [Candidatus Hydrogenedentes bacterium]|nr:hypothetical protein [Candidatus Hydrogenedentota bacterium]
MIAAAFDALQRELEEQIRLRMDVTRKSLLEHFDEEVGERQKVRKSQTQENLAERERWLLDLT